MYNAWGERSMYGKIFMGLIRSCVLIDEKGFVIKHWPKIAPKKQVPEVMKVLEEY